LIVGLLRNHSSSNKQCRSNPFLHRSRIICENREHCTPYGDCLREFQGLGWTAQSRSNIRLEHRTSEFKDYLVFARRLERG
jgi:hypothetical protein